MPRSHQGGRLPICLIAKKKEERREKSLTAPPFPCKQTVYRSISRP
jgi:hypothetical protein